MIRAHEEMGTDWRLRYATPDRPVHVLEFGMNCTEHTRHLILNAAHQISWLWELPERERVIPYRTRDRLLPEDEYGIARADPSLLSVAIMEASRSLYRLLYRRVTETPIRLLAEKAIAETIPEASDDQASYWSERISSMGQGYPTLLPHRLMPAYGTMRFDELACVDNFVAKPADNLTKFYEPAGSTSTLVQLLNDPALPSYKRAIEVTDIWASNLGLRDWYVWASNVGS